ncbi:hypothetical protein CNECB9_5080015 [Cupriavidus necator]|uniref:Uncharacterized protein n=1 Tax=Cupriavidus necator TaxID=106590 RepID=A0A1K0JVL0_CUPNE|nr:hypothetical protein CNECB9_5080015 [Cupriavidus necator]
MAYGREIGCPLRWSKPRILQLYIKSESIPLSVDQSAEFTGCHCRHFRRCRQLPENRSYDLFLPNALYLSPRYQTSNVNGTWQIESGLGISITFNTLKHRLISNSLNQHCFPCSAHYRIKVASDRVALHLTLHRRHRHLRTNHPGQA